MNLKRVALLVAALATIPAAGCGKLAEKATEKATEKVIEQACEDGGDCEVDLSKDGATVKRGDTEMSFGENADYPDGYPDYLKLDGFTPTQTIRSDDGSGSDGAGGFVVTTMVNPDAGGADSLAALSGQAEEAGCTPDGDTDSINARVSDMGMSMARLTCPIGPVQISLRDRQGSEQLLLVSIHDKE
jgi:hypothetical protein